MPSVHSFASAVHISQQEVVSMKLQQTHGMIRIKTVHPTQSHIGQMCIQFTLCPKQASKMWQHCDQKWVFVFLKRCADSILFLNSIQSWNKWKDNSICIFVPPHVRRIISEELLLPFGFQARKKF